MARGPMSVVTQGVATATMARGPISFVTPGAARAAMARGPISFVTPGAARAAMARGPISFVTPGAARAAMARGPISMHSGSEMTRPILSEDLIHPTIRDKVATNRVCIVREVQEVIASN